MPNDSVKSLAALMGLDRKTNADAVATAQALLANTNTAESMQAHTRRMGAVQDAFWKAKCPDYEPPEEEVGSNFVNCSIVSDQAINQLAALVGDGGSTPPPGTLPPPATKPKWWRIVAATLAAVLIGGLLVFAVAQYFLDAGDQPAIYEIIATDEPFAAPEPFTGE